MDDTIPGETGVVDNAVKLAVAELSRLLHQLGNMRIVEQIASNRSQETCELLRWAVDIR